MKIKNEYPFRIMLIKPPNFQDILTFICCKDDFLIISDNIVTLNIKKIKLKVMKMNRR